MTTQNIPYFQMSPSEKSGLMTALALEPATWGALGISTPTQWPLAGQDPSGEAGIATLEKIQEGARRGPKGSYSPPQRCCSPSNFQVQVLAGACL